MSLGVPENKQVGTLTERQRLALAAVLTAKNAPAGSYGRRATRSARVPTAPARAALATRRARADGSADRSTGQGPAGERPAALAR